MAETGFKFGPVPLHGLSTMIENSGTQRYETQRPPLKHILQCSLLPEKHSQNI